MSSEVWSKAVGDRVVMVAEFTDGSPSFMGRIISYTEQPTVTLELADGSHHSWRADMVRSADPEEVTDLLHKAMDANRGRA